MAKICKQCGQEYTTTGAEFCSIKCVTAYHNSNGHPNSGRIISEDLHREKVCPNCGIKFSAHWEGKSLRQRGEFCSKQCSNSFRNKKPVSDEMRQKLSESQKKRFDEHPETYLTKLRENGQFSGIEEYVKAYLDGKGLVEDVDYFRQKRVAGKFIDFYIPARNLILECDGEFWHRNQAKDIARDEIIHSAMPDVFIFHLHTYERLGHEIELIKKPTEYSVYLPYYFGRALTDNVPVSKIEEMLVKTVNEACNV